MFFYEVLLSQKIPSEVLTYKSELELNQGRLVKVPLRNKPCFGVILHKLENANFEIEKTKEISEILPYNFAAQQLKLIKIVAQNTFNSINIVFDAFLQPLKLLTKKDWIKLLDIFETDRKSSDNENTSIKAYLTANTTKPEYYIEIDILVRIIYIIRSQISIINPKAQSNQENSDSNLQNTNSGFKAANLPVQILIVFPEKKLLDKIFSNLKTNSDFNNLIFNSNFEILQFSGDVSAKSKNCIRELLNSTKSQIIFGTRSSLFLPFSNLKQIIVVDEANSFYIQEQNSLYYDARDLAFLTSSVLGAKLDFVSTLPSSRLHNFYSKTLLDTNTLHIATNNTKPLKIQISQRNLKNDHFKLFSDVVETAITGNDTNMGYFESQD